MKKCPKCKIEKDINQFYRNKSSGSGYSSWCKKCEKMQKWNKDKRFLNSWLPYFPKNPKCEVCGQELQYFTRNRLDSVHFDHKSNDLPIKGRPNHWLRRNKPTLKNLHIWESCNFGLLCSWCNRILPTDGRDDYLKKVIAYLKT